MDNEANSSEPSNSESESILTSVINITGERNKRALIRALMKSLTDFVEFHTLTFLKVTDKGSDQNLELLLCAPTQYLPPHLEEEPEEYGGSTVIQDALISQCIKLKSPVNQQQRSVFPIVVNHEVNSVLDITGLHHSLEMENLISGFIHVYSNFLDVLQDSERDPLTGLLNRKTFDSRFAEYLLTAASELPNNEAHSSDPSCKQDKRQAQEGQSHWIGLLDIDHFKLINDNYGHIYGDEVLLLFTDLMRKVFRNSDLLFRFGGEEFVVFIVDAKKYDALAAFDRFKKELEDFNFPQVGKATVTIGVTEINIHSHPSSLLEEADKALYYGKENGRNQVCEYHHLVEQGKIKPRIIKNDIDLF